MKVLITGANGFIGQNMAKYFLALNHEVIGWDIVKLESKELFTTEIVDLLRDDLDSKFKQFMPNVVIHCAGCANVSLSLQNPLGDFGGNTTVVYRILESMKNEGLDECKFIMLSSAAVYGQPVALPINEEDRLYPMSPYALHKKMAEEICVYYSKFYGMDCRIARVFSAYGPGLKKQIFWDMYNKIINTGKLEMFGNGDESRDFIYIDDLVHALYLIAMAEKNEIIYNVANGVEITIRNIAEEFVRHLGSSEIIFNGTIREGDPKNWCSDITKLSNLGYLQKIDINEGIKKYIEWCKL